jgi:hypothetical protein
LNSLENDSEHQVRALITDVGLTKAIALLNIEAIMAATDKTSVEAVLMTA